MLSFYSAAGVSCELIVGSVKGGRYKPGAAVPAQPSNMWCGVWLGPHIGWQLVDPHWGAAGSDADFWFLTPPEQFIFSHFPLDPNWQLLAEPVNAKQFQAMAWLQQAFFIEEIGDVSPGTSVIQCKKGSATVSVQAPGTTLSYHLDQLGPQQHGDLDGYVLMQYKNNKVQFFVELPHAGNFTLIVYGSDKECLIKWYLQCDDPSLCAEPLPNLKSDTLLAYGAGPDMQNLGMEEIYNEKTDNLNSNIENNDKPGGIITTDGEASIQFHLSQPLDLHFTLYEKDTPCQPDYYVRYYYLTSSILEVQIRAPDAGMYTLLISARPQRALSESLDSKTDSPYADVARYVVRADIGHIDPFPVSSQKGQIGQFKMLPLKSNTQNQRKSSNLEHKEESDTARILVSQNYFDEEYSELEMEDTVRSSTTRDSMILYETSSTESKLVTSESRRKSEESRTQTEESRMDTVKGRTEAIQLETSASINLQTQTHMAPLQGPILTCPDTGELSLCFEGTESVLPLEAELYFCSSNKRQNVSRFMMSESLSNNQRNFQMRFPEAGVYVAEVFDAADLVYVEVIYVSAPAPNCFSYPTITEPNNPIPGARILEPLNGQLMTHEQVLFRVQVPDAGDVYIDPGHKQLHCQESLDLWEGEIGTGLADQTLSLMVHMGGNQQTITMAVYEVGHFICSLVKQISIDRRGIQQHYGRSPIDIDQKCTPLDDCVESKALLN